MSGAVPIVRAIPWFCQPISALSHLAGSAAAVVGAVPLVRLGRGCPIRRRSLAVYSLSVIATLAISGTYHSLAWETPARSLMQRVDHFAIWLLIAGTFTGLHGTMYRGFWRTGVLAVVWGYASCGMLLQVFWFETFSSGAGLVLYLAFGWLGLISMIKLGREVGYRAASPIIYAGIAYTFGALFETLGRQTVIVHDWVGSHEVFHFLVLVGVALHWNLIRTLVTRHAPRLADVQPAAAVAAVPAAALGHPVASP